MDLDLIKADIIFTEHRLRVAHADRVGSLLPIGDASTAPRRRPFLAVAAFLSLPRVVSAAFRSTDTLAHSSR